MIELFGNNKSTRYAASFQSLNTRFGYNSLSYGRRQKTRYEHSIEIQRIYEYEKFDPDDQTVKSWLSKAAEQSTSNEAFAMVIVSYLRENKIVVPASTTLERLCAEELVAAENRITRKIAARLSAGEKARVRETCEVRNRYQNLNRAHKAVPVPCTAVLGKLRVET